MSATESVARWAWSGLVVGLFAVALAVLAWTWTSTQNSSAAFADSAVFERNHLGAGTVDVSVGDETIAFAAANMAAGDVTTGRLEIVNGGTLPLRYALSASTNGGPLVGVLQLVVWRETDRCSGAPPNAATRWRPLVDEATESDESPDDDPTGGRLAPGQTSLICMRGELPLAASSSAQGQRLDLLLTVEAVHDLDQTERDDGSGS